MSAGPGARRASTALVAGLVGLLILAISTVIAHRFDATSERALEQLFASSTERATSAVHSNTINIQVLLHAIVSLHERPDADATDLRRLTGRATSAGPTSSLPGVEQVVIFVDGPDGPHVATSQTIGLSRNINGTLVPPGSDLGDALARTGANGLATFGGGNVLAGADIVLVQRMPPDGQGRQRWAGLVMDRSVLLGRSLRGSNLAVTLRDATPHLTPFNPIEVIDVDPSLPAAERSNAPVVGLRHDDTLTIADRIVTLEYQTTEAFQAQLPGTPAHLVLLAGALVALMAGWLVSNQARRRAQAQAEAWSSTEQLVEEQRRFRSLAASSPVGIAYTDLDGTVAYANTRLATIVEPGVVPEEAEVEGHPLWRYLDGAEATALQRLLTDPAGSPERAFRATLRDGRVVQLRLAVITDDHQERIGWAVTVEDITRSVRRQEELRREEHRHRELATRFAHRAAHDALTELPNRTHITEWIEDRLGRGGAPELGLLFADLDGFKVVNDSLGHQAGDQLLKLVAERVRRVVRPNDIAARLGGDEFAIVVGEVDSPDDLERVADRLLDALERPFEVDGRRVSISASVGMTLAQPGRTARDLLRDADLAMYEAKRERGARWRWYESTMHDRMQERHDLENELRDALRWGGLSTALQPAVDLATGRDVFVEALARWHHPRLGQVPPSAFIPVIEEIGLIGRLGRTMLHQSATHAAAWHDPRVGLSVNVTAAEVVETDAASRLAETLAECGLPPERLVLELTETDLASDDPLIPEGLAAIRAAGVRVAIDDFGTGRSSLAKLRELPVDILKIDRAFVRDIDRSPRDRAFVEAIVRLAGTLDLVTVAEGIETEAQLATLRSIGCDLGQGYHLARPMAPAAMAARLQTPDPSATSDPAAARLASA
jgi:diguanylate cyclase (GGDEF)-like protein/PAS domain S-box-containing protein